MTRANVLPALTAALSCAIAIGAGAEGSAASAQTHCRHAADVGPWPHVLAPHDERLVEAADGRLALSAVRRVVAAFHRSWRAEVLPNAPAEARALASCMRSQRSYYLRPVAGRAVADRGAAVGGAAGQPIIMWGSLETLVQHPWVWELRYGGWSQHVQAAGTWGGYVTADAEVLALAHWPEG